MNSLDILVLSLKNLFRRRMRTFLAILGVVVGTCSVIIMLSIGFGLSQGFADQIENWGDLHLIEVYGGGGGMMTNSNGDTEEVKLDDKTIDKIDKMEEVQVATPIYEPWSSFYMVSGKYKTYVSLRGIRPEAMQYLNFTLADGRFLEKGEEFEIVLGYNIPYRFYDPKDDYSYYYGDEEPLVDVMTAKMTMTGDWYVLEKRPQGEKEIKYEEYKVDVAGLLVDNNDFNSYYSYMDIDTVKKMYRDSAKAEGNRVEDDNGVYDSALVYVKNVDDVSKINSMLKDEMGFYTSNALDYLDSLQETAGMIQTVLGGIGAISLFVAAFGIANTMIMSIYERTKEIGVMKVIGSNLKDIRKMFLLEAGLIGFMGGLLGVATSYLLSYLMNTVFLEAIGMFMGDMFWQMHGASQVSVIPLWLPVGGLLFATAVGIVSGYYPAKRAMNLSALESLKNE